MLLCEYNKYNKNYCDMWFDWMNAGQFGPKHRLYYLWKFDYDCLDVLSLDVICLDAPFSSSSLKLNMVLSCKAFPIYHSFIKLSGFKFISVHHQHLPHPNAGTVPGEQWVYVCVYHCV